MTIKQNEAKERQSIILAAYYKGLTYKQIAERYGVTANHAARVVKRGLMIEALTAARQFVAGELELRMDNDDDYELPARDCLRKIDDALKFGENEQADERTDGRQ